MKKGIIAMLFSLGVVTVQAQDDTTGYTFECVRVEKDGQALDQQNQQDFNQDFEARGETQPLSEEPMRIEEQRGQTENAKGECPAYYEGQFRLEPKMESDVRQQEKMPEGEASQRDLDFYIQQDTSFQEGEARIEGQTEMDQEAQTDEFDFEAEGDADFEYEPLIEEDFGGEADTASEFQFDADVEQETQTETQMMENEAALRTEPQTTAVEVEVERDESTAGKIIKAPFRFVGGTVAAIGEGVGHIVGGPIKGVGKAIGGIAKGAFSIVSETAEGVGHVVTSPIAGVREAIDNDRDENVETVTIEESEAEASARIDENVDTESMEYEGDLDSDLEYEEDLEIDGDELEYSKEIE